MIFETAVNCACFWRSVTSALFSCSKSGSRRKKHELGVMCMQGNS